jgi:C4-dicarboxylate-binding protein DctP
MSQGMFDAFQSTPESCISARLWDTGLHFTLIDHQFLAVYVPLVSGEFWSRLSPALRTLFTDLWVANISAWRSATAAAQDKAEAILKAHNVRMITVTGDDVSEQRARMLVEQERAAHEMNISSGTLARVMEVTTESN